MPLVKRDDGKMYSENLTKFILINVLLDLVDF